LDLKQEIQIQRQGNSLSRPQHLVQEHWCVRQPLGVTAIPESDVVWDCVRSVRESDVVWDCVRSVPMLWAVVQLSPFVVNEASIKQFKFQCGFVHSKIHCLWLSTWYSRLENVLFSFLWRGHWLIVMLV
jgi:hypothetical protein